MSTFIEATENNFGLLDGKEEKFFINVGHIRQIKKWSDQDIQIWVGVDVNALYRITDEQYQKLISQK